MRPLPASSLLLLVVIQGCTFLPEQGLGLSSLRGFQPERFFEGRTEGRGTLKVLFKPPQAVRVQSRGKIERDGTLVLRQRVEREGEAPTTREWRLRRGGDGRFTGTLNEASGPVAGEVRGGALRLRYPMEGGLWVEQVLTPAPEGTTLDNRLEVRKFGLPVARLSETIRKAR